MVEWCEATGTRPTLPFAPQLLVGRGSFYYLFRPSGLRLPTNPIPHPHPDPDPNPNPNPNPNPDPSHTSS